MSADVKREGVKFTNLPRFRYGRKVGGWKARQVL